MGRAAVGLAIIGVSVIGWNWPREAPMSEEEDAFEREHDVAVNTGGSVVVSAWGTGLAILFTTIAFAAFLLSYFYLRLENPVWPPRPYPLPEVWPALRSMGLVAPSGIAIWLAQRRLRSGSRGGYLAGLTTVLVLAAAGVWVYVHDLAATPFGATDHAYAAIYHTLSGYMVTLAGGAMLMVTVVLFWSWRGLYGPRRHGAVANVSRFWNAMIIMWMIGAAVLAYGPRLT